MIASKEIEIVDKNTKGLVRIQLIKLTKTSVLIKHLSYYCEIMEFYLEK